MSKHVHLVSDATGETIGAIARACLAQFNHEKPTVHHWYLVRSSVQLETVCEGIENYPGLVLYTFVDRDLHKKLDAFCEEKDYPAVAILDPALEALGAFLGQKSVARPGRQHKLDENYFRRIEAMDYTLHHDDGQMRKDLYEADVILVGISRTSKTPTSIYLANRGIKAANVPIVPGIALPPELEQASNALIVGLTVDVDRLIHVRKTRLKYLQDHGNLDYVDEEKVRDELRDARRLYAQKNWPVIDVTRRSIEETAAEIITLLNQKRGEAGLELS